MSKYDDLRKSVGIAPVATSSNKSKPRTQGVNFSTREATAAPEPIPDVSTRPVRPTRMVSAPSFDVTQSPLLRDIAANPLSNTPIQDAIAEGASKVANVPVIKPVLHGLGKAIDFVENLPVIKQIGGGLAGAYNEIAEAPSAASKDWISQARKNIASLATSDSGNAPLQKGLQSIIEGAKNPEEARAKKDEIIASRTEGMGPVSKFGYEMLSQGATDPLSLIPAGGVGRVPKIANVSGDLLKAAPKSTVSALRDIAAGKAAQAVEDVVPARTEEIPTSPVAEPIHEVSPEAQAMKGNWFTNLFGDQGLGITPFGSKKRLSNKPLTSKEAIVQKGIVNSNEGMMDSIKAGLESAHTAAVDDLSPFKMVSSAAQETAMDSRRANNLANNLLKEKFVTPEGKVVGPSFSDTFLKVARGKDMDFLDYLIKRDAIDRVEKLGQRVYDDSVKVYDANKRDLVSLNDAEVLKREVAKDEAKYPEFKQLGEEFNKYNDNLLQHYGVDTGMLTPEAKAAMQAARPNYIKTQRQFSRSEKPLKNIVVSSRRGFSGQNLPIKRATGSGRNIVDPRKTMAEQTGAFVNASMRNRAMQEVVKEVTANPEKFKGVVDIVDETSDATKKTLDEINKVISEDGMAGLTELFDKQYESAFKKASQQGNKDNAVTVMVNGNPVKLRISNPSLINAVTGMGPQATSLLGDVLGAFSRATKRGATGVLAPAFITKSAVMDFPQAILQSKNPIQQAGLSVYAVLSGIGDKLNIPGLKNMAEEYRLAGGDFSPALKGEAQLNKNVMNMTRYPIFSGKNALKVGVNTVSAPFKALHELGSVFENAPRIAASKIVRNQLGNAKTPEAVRAAMSAGREATVNYLRRGTFTNQAESLVPYTNAAIQGTYRILKGFKENPVRTIAAIGTLGVLPKMYEYMQFSDDPDYQNLPARERMRFLIVNKNEDGTFTKIPMDPAYNSFGEMTIEALRKFKDNDPTAFKGTADALANAWTPPFVTGALQGATQGTGLEGSIVGALNSTVAAPAVAIASNKRFTGAPIEPASVTGNSKSERYNEQTSSLAKTISKYIGLSPMKTDYLISAYGGDLARFGLPLTSDVGSGTKSNTLLKHFIVDPAFTNSLTNDFYGYKTRLNEVFQDNKDHDVPLPTWYDDALRREISSTAKGSLSSQIKELTDKKKEVSSNMLLPAEGKSAQIRELQSKINNIYMDINSRMYRKGVPIQGSR